jgi:DNA-binding CsgD family transcriptional regulator
MKYRPGFFIQLSSVLRSRVDAWKSMSSIGRVIANHPQSFPLSHRRVGYGRRSRTQQFALSLSEREEISWAEHQPLRAIARQLRRAPSTISREVRRNADCGYRASRSDQAAWDRALRPWIEQAGLSPMLARASIS